MPIRKKTNTRIYRAFHALEILSDQTAVHRKKFEYALSQIRLFIQWYIMLDIEVSVPKEEISCAKTIMIQFQELKNVLCQYILQTWTIPTIENPSDHVITQLKSIIGEIKSAIKLINEDLSNQIDSDSSQWDQFHVLDLRAIAASFAAYLQTNGVDDSLVEPIQNRLSDITSNLALHDTSSITMRVFSPIPICYQNWRVSIEDFEFVKEIGSGLSANVFLGIDKRSGEKVALKQFKDLRLNGPRLQYFQREVAVLAVISKISHPSLLHFLGATDTPPFCIVTEYMENGSLYQDIRHNHILDGTSKTIAAYDIARGMQYLHSCQIVHRDLKSLNVLLDRDFRIRICDFGFSRSMGGDDSFKSQNMGTPQWMAPEILESNKHYTSKIDVYAYAIVLAEMLTGQTPYVGIEDPKTIRQRVLNEDLRPYLPSGTNPRLRDLVTQCWDREPDVRPTFDEIVKRFESLEIFFKGCDIDRFRQYIRESKTSSELIDHEIDTILNAIIAGDPDSMKIAKKLFEFKIPPNYIDKAWRAIMTLRDKTESTDEVIEYSSFLTIFISSSKMNEATDCLRKIKNGGVNESTIMSFINEIPTGSTDTDASIIIAACKNGASDVACLYAVNPRDITLALESCIRGGISDSYKTAIIDKCVQMLSHPYVALQIASLRCLIVFESVKRLTTETIQSLLDSSNLSLSTLSYLALSTKGTMPVVLLKYCVSKWNTNQWAALALVSSCKDCSCANYLVNLIGDCSGVLSEYEIRILISSYLHESLKPRVRSVIQSRGYPKSNNEIMGFLKSINVI